MSIIHFFKSFFSKEKPQESMKKYLIVGLGNVGSMYRHTRHNIGFEVLDALAESQKAVFEPAKLGSLARFRYKGRQFILLKPSTYMNLSGKAVRYWLQKEKVPLENLLVISDDLSLTLGSLRMKPKGNAGGHNGLQHIQDLLQTNKYPRLRFGIGHDFPRGGQSDFVLGKWEEAEAKTIQPRIEKAVQAVLSFGTSGINHTMNHFNESVTAK